MNNLNPTKNPKSRHILQNTVRDLKCQCFSKLVFPVKERLKNCSRLKETREMWQYHVWFWTGVETSSTSRVSESVIWRENEKRDTRIQRKARIRGPTPLQGEGPETESKPVLLYFQPWMKEYAGSETITHVASGPKNKMIINHWVIRKQ